MPSGAKSGELVHTFSPQNPIMAQPGDRKWRAVVAVERSIRLDLPEAGTAMGETRKENQSSTMGRVRLLIVRSNM